MLHSRVTQDEWVASGEYFQASLPLRSQDARASRLGGRDLTRSSGNETTSLRRWSRLGVGLVVFALGLALMVRADLGLSPWDVFHQALHRHTSLSFGQVVVAVSLVVVVLGWCLGVRPGPGTVANSVLVGVVTDVFLSWLDYLGEASTWIRLVATLLGVAGIAIGTAVYIGAGLGAGPRDGLMLGVARLTRSTPGAARVVIEGSVLVAGVALGGTVGIGTISFVVAIGPAINGAFRLFSMTDATSKRDGGLH